MYRCEGGARVVASQAASLGFPCCILARNATGRPRRLRGYLRHPPTLVVECSDLGSLSRAVKDSAFSSHEAETEKQLVIEANSQTWGHVVRVLDKDTPGDFDLRIERREELLAELVSAQGYGVVPANQTGGSGYDINARRKGDLLFPSSYLVKGTLRAPARRVDRPMNEVPAVSAWPRAAMASRLSDRPSSRAMRHASRDRDACGSSCAGSMVWSTA